MKPVSEIIKDIKPGSGWLAEPIESRETRRGKGGRVTLDALESTHPRVDQAIEAARSWAKRKRDGHMDTSIVLCGPVGTGKTHIAKAILWSVYNSLDDGTPIAPVGRFYAANDLIQALDSGVFVYSLIPNTSPMVVIDDVGQEQQIPFIGSDGQADELSRRYFKAIDYCYTYQVSVVMTSNLSPGQLANHIGGRAWSRLQEMAPKGLIVDLSGVPDYRKRRSGR